LNLHVKSLPKDGMSFLHARTRNYRNRDEDRENSLRKDESDAALLLRLQDA